MSKAEDASINGSNLTAVEAISTRLAEVTRLAEKLDAKLCEAGARTRPVPVSAAALSTTLSTTTTTLTSPTTNFLSTSTPATISSSQSTVAAIAPSLIKPMSPVSPKDAATPSSPALSTATVIEAPSKMPISSPIPAADGTEASMRIPMSVVLPSTPALITKQSVPQSLERQVSSPMVSAPLSAPTAESVLTSSESYRVSSPVPASSVTVRDKHETFAVSSTVASSAPYLPTSNGDLRLASSGVISPLYRFRSPPLESSAKHKEKETSKEEEEKNCEESATEDSAYEGYVTATECSTTAPSRSDSFVTSPDCDEIPLTSTATVLPITMSSFPSTWWTSETPEIQTTATVCSKADKESDKPMFLKEATTRVAKQISAETDGIAPIDRLVSLEKTVEERTGKVVKEVTETTTLRVSHDIRLDVASYKVTSNILQDHRQDVDVKEMQDSERTVIEDSQAKQHEEIPSEDMNKTKPAVDDTLRSFVQKISQEKKSYSFSKECKDVSTVRLSRQHEDSGIEMSPTKKESADGDILEEMRKVSPSDSPTDNKERTLTNGSSRSCSHEAACYEQLSSEPCHYEIPAGSLTNENNR